jgi:hypothetical protein
VAAGGFDVLACPQCGGHVRLIALIDNPRVVQRILAHLRVPSEVPEPLRGYGETAFALDPGGDD